MFIVVKNIRKIVSVEPADLGKELVKKIKDKVTVFDISQLVRANHVKLFVPLCFMLQFESPLFSAVSFGFKKKK